MLFISWEEILVCRANEKLAYPCQANDMEGVLVIHEWDC